ncbi:MAG: formylglycine-generating enzyme family protein [Verrucomicrobiota bacterium]
MKPLLAPTLGFLLGCTSFAQSAPPAPAKESEPLTWTTKSGEVYTARFVRLSGDLLVLEQDRQEIDLRASSLREPDLAQARKLAGLDELPRRASPKTNAPEMHFVPVPVNTFQMGSTDKELGHQTEETYHRVSLTLPFSMKTTEVTWAEWNWVREQATSRSYTDISPGTNGQCGDSSGNHPVLGITWWDAVKWCNLLSEIEGLTPVYYTHKSLKLDCALVSGTPELFVAWNSNGYRLPTEAEWEYACRPGTSKLSFHTGPIKETGIQPPDPSLDQAGWFGGNSGATTHPVKEKGHNRLGLYDMHGNAAEWCWDVAGAIKLANVSDPRGPLAGGLRVHRGGSWSDPAERCRATARASRNPTDQPNRHVGFRPVRSASR